MTEMTQREAVARAWRAAEVATERAGGTPQRADVWAAVAQAWAAVAAQLPFEPRPAPDETAVISAVEPGQGGDPAGMCHCDRIDGPHMFGAYGCEVS